MCELSLGKTVQKNFSFCSSVLRCHKCRCLRGVSWVNRPNVRGWVVVTGHTRAQLPVSRSDWCVQMPRYLPGLEGGCACHSPAALSDRIWLQMGVITGLPTWLRSREAACQCRRRGFVLLQEEVATHCGAPAWRVPWTEEPGGLQSVGLQRVRRDLAAGDTHRVIMGSQWVASKSQTDWFTKCSVRVWLSHLLVLLVSSQCFLSAASQDRKMTYKSIAFAPPPTHDWKSCVTEGQGIF